MNHHILNYINQKGLLETVLHGFIYCKTILFLKIKIFWLRIRGYEVDFSVEFRGMNTIFQSTKKSIQISKNCVVGLGVIIRTGFTGKIFIGRGVGIYDYSIIDIQDKIEIGDNTLIAPYCYITDYDHKMKDKNTPIISQGYETSPIIIGRNVWLGAKVIVLKGVKIGDNTVIGAGSVVTSDIPPNSVAVGIPAKVVKKI